MLASSFQKTDPSRGHAYPRRAKSDAPQRWGTRSLSGERLPELRFLDIDELTTYQPRQLAAKRLPAGPVLERVLKGGAFVLGLLLSQGLLNLLVRLVLSEGVHSPDRGRQPAD